MSSLRLATRRSPLALAQAQFVQRRLLEFGVSSELVLVETTGDRRVDVALSEVGGQGVFTVEVQRSVIDGDADVAVHSAKDLPSLSPEELTLVAVAERLDPADVLVGRSLAGLGPGATVATGSPRRRALLLERRPDLNIVGLRGNMASRLDAAGQSGIDAVVAAAAALERLGWLERVAERLDPMTFVPQVGQGSIALEARRGDSTTQATLEAINNVDGFTALMVERAFLRELGAGCSIAAAAYAVVEGHGWRLRSLMAAADGSTVLRDERVGTNGELLGRAAACWLRDELGGAQLTGWSA